MVHPRFSNEGGANPQGDGLRHDLIKRLEQTALNITLLESFLFKHCSERSKIKLVIFRKLHQGFICCCVLDINIQLNCNK